MALPAFNSDGDLPEGVHPARFDEVIGRFGAGATERVAVTARLQRIHKLAAATGKLDRLVIFGSYVTAKPEPNDVDVVLVMRNDFVLADCDAGTGKLFDHREAASEFGASVFWIRPSMLILETLDVFIRRLADQTRPEPKRHRGGEVMIQNDQELQTTQDRIAYFQHLLMQLRVTASRDEFPSVASGYRAELENMQKEVLDYLSRHASQPVPIDAG